MPERDSWRPHATDIAVSLALLTRLPLPRLSARAVARQGAAAWAFPLAGLVVALLAGAAGWAALASGLAPGPAAGLALAAQIALTGALHEDGLADSADGLGGGWTRERRLEIMRDSRIGTYGVLALILSLGLRWTALAGLYAAGMGFAALIAAAVLSRAALPALMTALPPARSDGLARDVGAPGRPAAWLAALLGLALALVAAGSVVLVPALLALGAVTLLARLAMRRIGGQTGDILGAAQQLAEIVLFLGLAAQAG